MKKLLVLILIVCCSVMAFAQDTGETEAIDATTIENFDDEANGNSAGVGGAEFVTIENFNDGAAAWTIRGSDDVVRLDSRIVEAGPTQPFENTPEEIRRAYGIRAEFEQQGRNYIEIIPPDDVMRLPGFVQEIEMWVWNTDREYYLTAELEDILGVRHYINLGSIDHLGWAKVSAEVPDTARQPKGVYQSLDTEGLRLIKFTLWTVPTERVDDFQLYFDEIRVLSDDVAPLQFDGIELADPDFIRNTWNGG